MPLPNLSHSATPPQAVFPSGTTDIRRSWRRVSRLVMVLLAIFRVHPAGQPMAMSNACIALVLGSRTACTVLPGSSGTYPANRLTVWGGLPFVRFR